MKKATIILILCAAEKCSSYMIFAPFRYVRNQFSKYLAEARLDALDTKSDRAEGEEFWEAYRIEEYTNRQKEILRSDVVKILMDILVNEKVLKTQIASVYRGADIRITWGDVIKFLKTHYYDYYEGDNESTNTLVMGLDKPEDLYLLFECCNYEEEILEVITDFIIFNISVPRKYSEKQVCGTYGMLKNILDLNKFVPKEDEDRELVVYYVPDDNKNDDMIKKTCSRERYAMIYLLYLLEFFDTTR